MNENKCCGAVESNLKDPGYETIRMPRAVYSCHLCEDYAKENTSTPIAVMCCEGGCLRGEIARQAANIICYELAAENTVRICLGGAFTKDTGQRGLVRDAKKLIAVEGCSVECASRMMKGVIPGLTPQIIIADNLIEFDRTLFGMDQMSAEDVSALALTVAQKVVNDL